MLHYVFYVYTYIYKWIENNVKEKMGRRCSSETQHLPGKCEALSLILSPKKKKTLKRKIKICESDKTHYLYQSERGGKEWPRWNTFIFGV